MKQIFLVALTTIFTNIVFGQNQIQTDYYTFTNDMFIKSERYLEANIETFSEENIVQEKQYTSLHRKGKTTYEYNDNKQKIAENIFLPNGKLERRITFEYNSKGYVTLTKTNWTDKDGQQIEFTESFGYNNKNELITKVHSSNKLGIEMVFTYEITKENNQKKIVEHRQNFGRELADKTIFYNDYGLELKEITKAGEETYQYEFDGSGNWTTKKIYKDGKLVGEIRKTKIG